jgi:hypothetical protein
MASFNKVHVKKLYIPNAHATKKAFGRSMGQVTATADELNIMDGVTATAAELNIMDGSAPANNVASVAVMLDSSKQIHTAGHIGTTGLGVIANEFGDGLHHMTRLSFSSATVLSDPGGTGNQTEGVLIYTFPATGDIIVNSTTGAVGLKATANAADASVELGVGSVLGTGANATIGASNATMEDYMEGTANGTCDGAIDVVLTTVSTAGTPVVLTKGANKLHFNAATNWTAADATMYPTGVVWVDWSIRIY